METVGDTTKQDAFPDDVVTTLKASWNSMDVIGRAIISAITKRSNSS
jgi:hypothetical protein